ncbi:hypothetical protein D6858_01945 [Tsuneonella suprasediminis]|uniref:Glycosyltransferase RgtA/B/C/D-like domain-containing protein n=1 Tax=Tsuneonella suprasediminis TaxID=2306996 RepID=A0A419R5I0_9SPHN|nr:hypothetical protein [Tsuneonella suprasediminis]RJX70764.1 hypothetical protein D6858_01945 [Tsuneonella suprasediminis]
MIFSAPDVLTAKRGPFSYAAFAILLAISLVPLMAVGLPPLSDLYGHLGRYVIQTDLANRPELAPYYAFEWKVIGNLGVDLLVEVLHSHLGLEGAVKASVIATQLLAATGILAISRQVHGRITPFAILALPLIYGFPFNFGFLNFSLAMALALVTFAIWLRLRQSAGRWWPHLLLAVVGPVIWLCHTYGWAFLGLMCGSAALADAIERKDRPQTLVLRVLGECWPLLLPLIPMLAWRADTGKTVTGEWLILLKAFSLASPLRTGSLILDGLSLQIMVIFGYWAARSKWAHFDLRLALAAIFCAVAFLIMPPRIFGSYFADMRLVPYMFALALLAISPRRFPRQIIRWMTCLALAFFIARMAITTFVYVEREKTLERTLVTLDAVPRGAKLATFVIAPCAGSWEPPILWHIGSMALVRRNAIVNDQWEFSGLNPLRIHNPTAGYFARDPSQMVEPDTCTKPNYPHLSDILRHLPRDAFTYVWVVGELPAQMPEFADLRPLPHRGAGVLYKVMPTSRSNSTKVVR